MTKYTLSILNLCLVGFTRSPSSLRAKQSNLDRVWIASSEDALAMTALGILSMRFE